MENSRGRLAGPPWQRLCVKLSLAALFTAIVLMSGVIAVEATAIRLTVDDGTTTRYWYSGDGEPNVLISSPFTINGYNTVVDVVFSNFPGSPVCCFGTLTQQVSILETTGMSPLPDLTFFAEIVNDVGLGTGEVTGGDIATLLAGTIADWTLPVGSPRMVTADTGASHNPTFEGTAQTTTHTDLGSVSSLMLNLDESSEVIQSAIFADPTPNAYQLSQELVISGVNAGASNIVVNANSSVSAVPEPRSTLLLGFGLGAVALLGWRKRLRGAETG